MGSTIAAPSSALVVEAFRDSVRDVVYNNCRSASAELKSYASIQEVSAFFSLNSRQHVAYILIAIPLLCMIAGIDVPDSHGQLFNGLPIIITGAGGSGKSQIIAAVRALATAWGRTSAISVVASTRIAAASLQGTTMHSSVGLGIRLSHLPKHIESPSDTLLRQWAPVTCVIADEVSMTDLAFFGLWEESLRHVKDHLDDPFGGMLAVLMFDHYQLRTVSGLAMFKTSNRNVAPTPPQDRGKRLYRSITKVVYLEENMRFTQDPEWGRWLASGLLGNWPHELQSFISNLPDSNDLRVPVPQGIVQTISTDNATRTVVNETAIRVAVRCLGTERRVYMIPARLSRRVSPSEMNVIRQLPDNKTGSIPLFLQIYIDQIYIDKCCCNLRMRLFF